jgi:hypothetical protein
MFGSIPKAKGGKNDRAALAKKARLEREKRNKKKKVASLAVRMQAIRRGRKIAKEYVNTQLLLWDKKLGDMVKLLGMLSASKPGFIFPVAVLAPILTQLLRLEVLTKKIDKGSSCLYGPEHSETHRLASLTKYIAAALESRDPAVNLASISSSASTLVFTVNSLTRICCCSLKAGSADGALSPELAVRLMLPLLAPSASQQTCWSPEICTLQLQVKNNSFHWTS